jgi:hypothetical protein
VEKFNREIRLMNEHTRSNVKEAVRRGTREVDAGAEARAPKRSGELASTIRDEYSKSGLVGYAKAGYGKLTRRSRATTPEGKAKAQARRENMKLQLALANTSKQALSVVNLGVYAPVVERGDKRRHKPARPFMVPAFKAAKPAIMSEMKTALNSATRETGAKV